MEKAFKLQKKVLDGCGMPKISWENFRRCMKLNFVRIFRSSLKNLLLASYMVAICRP